MATNSPRYEADSLTQLLRERQELNWLVEGWLEQHSLAVLVGQEGSFKSFAAGDIGMSVGTGTDWQGCRVKPGRVLLIAGEARVGWIRRLRGWCDHHERADVDEVLLGRSGIQLMDPTDAERVAELGHFDLVIVDTLARNFGPGSENDQKDMAAAIRNADRIKDATGATVLLIHHTPLDGREAGKIRPRGSSALSGAADAILTAQYDRDSKVVTLSSIKQKDAPNPPAQFLTHETVDLGEHDNFGNPITTLVLCPTHLRPTPKRKVTGKYQRLLVREIRSRANGSQELLISVRDLTANMDISSRQARGKLEQWFREQSWVRPAAGGHFVDLQALPNL